MAAAACGFGKSPSKVVAQEYGKWRWVERQRGGIVGEGGRGVGSSFVEGTKVTGAKVEVEGSTVRFIIVSEGLTNIFGQFVLVVSRLSMRKLFWSI